MYSFDGSSQLKMQTHSKCKPCDKGRHYSLAIYVIDLYNEELLRSKSLDREMIDMP